MSKDETQKFVERILTEKGTANLSSEVREQLAKDLADRLENRVNASILAALPPDKVQDFDKLLESGSDAEVQDFCLKNISNLPELVAAEMLNFRQTYLTA